MQPIMSPKQTVRRALALTLVLCAVAVLLLATALTSQAFVKSTGHDTLDDFVQGSFSRTGLLQLPEEQSVQLMPMGLVLHWDVATSSLNSGLREMAAVAAGGHIVVMGGLTSSASGWTNQVQVSTIQTDGSPGAWLGQTNPLPNSVAGSAAAVHTPEGEDYSWIYLAGGFFETTWYSNVLRTTLDHTTGTVGPWTNVEGLPFKSKNGQLVSLDGYLYLIGGEGIDPSSGLFTSDEVYYASIEPSDGSLSAWQRTSDLPEPLESFLVLPYQDESIVSLYAIGGRTDGFPANTAHVWYTDVDTGDGTLDAWGPLAVSDWRFGDLPHTLFGHSGALVADAMLVTGGNEQEEGGSENTTRNIRAALIDATESDYRLYNWCGEVPYPQCTIGAWAAGEGLPEKRVWHATVASGPFFYTLGGATSKTGTPLSSVYWGGVVADTLDAYYAPSGYYVSPEIDLGVPRTPRRVEWDITMGFPAQQELELTYRTAGLNHTWGDWKDTSSSQDGLNGYDIPSETGEIRYFQYRVDMTTEISKSSPLLNKVDLYYEVDDPEVEVRKDTGTVISAELGTVLNYSIVFTNNGGVTAEGVVLTETLPAHTTYASGAAWTQIGSSDVYTYWVGDLGIGERLNTQFSVRVNNNVPASIATIDNVVDIGFPPMEDGLGDMIPDADLDNNHYEFSNPLSAFSISVSKSADPIPGTQLKTGQQIKYTLTCENVGQEPVTGLVLEDALHTQVSYVAGSIWPAAQGDDSNSTKLKWNIGSLAPGESSTAGFTVQVKEGTPDGTIITNQFSADSNQTSSKKSSTVAHPVGEPDPGVEEDLTLTKSAVPDTYSQVTPGDKIDYSFTYENTGEETLTGLELVDALSEDVTYVAGSIWPAAQGDDNDPTQLRWTIGSLAPGAKGTAGFSVKVKDDLPGSVRITNLFTGQCDQIDLISSNMVHHDTYIEGPDLVVTKIKAEPTEPQIGDAFNLVVTVKNQGTQDANDGEFWVEVYIKPYPGAWPTGPDDHDMGFCLGGNCIRDQHVEYIDSLAVGKSFDFRFSGIQLPGGGINEVFAQADICFAGYYCRDPRYGWYLEQNERNNIKSTILNGNVVHLPMIPKEH